MKGDPFRTYNHFAILHKPTNQFFPAHPLNHFIDLFKETYAHYPPRLFRRRSDAERYISAYCKGTRDDYTPQGKVIYKTYPNRSPEDFVIVTLEIKMTGTAA